MNHVPLRSFGSSIRGIDRLGTKLGIKELKDWYSLSKDKLRLARSSGLLEGYSGSLYRALRGSYPQHDWLGWKFDRSPFRFWENVENQRSYLDWLGKKLDWKTKDDYYGLTADILLRNEGRGILERFKSSPCKMVRSIYPNHIWLPWKFRPVPHFLWDDPKNPIIFFEWLAKELNIKEMNDWYQLKADTLRDYGGAGILHKYESSPVRILRAIFPEHEWIPWKFSWVPHGFWGDLSNRRNFLEWLRDQLGFQNLDDMHQLTRDKIVGYGGRGILDHCNGSVFVLLKSTYPDQEWTPWRLNSMPKDFWNNKENNPKQLIDFVADQLHIRTLEDWYKISLSQISSVAPITLFKQKGLKSLLKESYPDHDWDSHRFSPLKSSQRLLVSMIKDLFPNKGNFAKFDLKVYLEIHEDFFDSELLFSSGKRMQLDIYIPEFRLGLEYQGEQHYYDVFAFGPKWMYEIRDQEKKDQCQAKDITLIEIPFWWDRTKASLEATIYEYRPDIIKKLEKGSPIQKEMPKSKGYIL